MNQSNRTLVYVGVAVAALAVAYFTRPAPVAKEVTEADTELLLFPEFKDPTKAASLAIKRFNEDKLSFDEFEVVERNGVWTLPSHDNYPADAKDQVVRAATLLSDLRLTGIETNQAEGQQRERYGLMEPTIDNFQKSGGASMGTRVTVRDAAKKDLADLIIGKEVPGKPDQRYVAVPGQNRIATIKVDVAKLSTKFSDWIETDLLKLGSVWDVSKLSLHDYSFDLERGPQDRSRMTFVRPQDKNEWQIVDLKQFDEKDEKYVSALPGEDEQLDSQKIDDMRSALNELKIVNVEKKPAKFRESLAATGDVNLTQETARSLQNKGFYLVRAGDDDSPRVAIVSTDGELTVSMKDGVEYLLRFGAVADFDKDGNEKPKADASSGSDKDGEKKDADSADKKDGESGDKGGINLHRYLFVTAQFNEEMIEKPAFEKLPEATPAGQPMDKPAEAAAEEPAEKPTDDGAKPADGEKPAEEAKPAEEKSAEEKPADVAPAKDGETKDGDATGEEPKTDEPPKSASVTSPSATSPLRLVALQDEQPTEQPKAAEGDKPAAETKPAEAKSTDDKPAAEAEPAEGDKPADAAATTVPQPDAAQPSPEDAAKKLDAERKRIEAENKRKQDEYDEKVKAAQKKVKELNERFADWYYVIPEEVYKKIHLSRADVIKKKEKPASGTTPGEPKPSDINTLPPTLGN